MIEALTASEGPLQSLEGRRRRPKEVDSWSEHEIHTNDSGVFRTKHGAISYSLDRFKHTVSISNTLEDSIEHSA